MRTTERTKIVNILSNIFIKDYNYCSTIFKSELIETQKMPLEVVSRIMSQPNTLLKDFDFSVVVWMYQALINNSRYKGLLPAQEIIFTPEELSFAEHYVFTGELKPIVTEKKNKVTQKVRVTNRNREYYFPTKNEFLKEITANEEDEKAIARLYTSYCGIFNKLEDTEKFLGKEVNKFSVDELIDVFERNGWATVGSFRVRKSLLKTYICWLNKRQHIKYTDDKVLPITMITLDNISSVTKMKQLFIKDFDDLVNMLDFVFQSDQYIMFKLMCYLSWFGFVPSELYSLLKSDVDLATSTISSWETSFSVSNLPEVVMDLCRECLCATEYLNDEGEREVLLTYKDNKYLFRSFKATNKTIAEEYNDLPINFTYVTRHYKAWSKLVKQLEFAHPYYGRDISLNRIYKSGMYYKIYQYEQASGNTISQKVIDDICRVPEDTGKIIFLADYIQWKNTFYGE